MLFVRAYDYLPIDSRLEAKNIMIGIPLDVLADTMEFFI